jgi:hypothetical protein
MQPQRFYLPSGHRPRARFPLVAAREQMLAYTFRLWREREVPLT